VHRFSKTNSLLVVAEQTVGGLRSCLDQDDSLSGLQRYIGQCAGVWRYVCQRDEGLLGAIRGTRHWLESVRWWAISPSLSPPPFSRSCSSIGYYISREYGSHRRAESVVESLRKLREIFLRKWLHFARIAVNTNNESFIKKIFRKQSNNNININI